MEMQEALSSRPKGMKKPKNELREINLKKANNGGVVAEHRMSEWSGKEPVHAFGADEGHKLASHIQEHLGIKMPAEAADPEETEDNE